MAWGVVFFGSRTPLRRTARRASDRNRRPSWCPAGPVRCTWRDRRSARGAGRTRRLSGSAFRQPAAGEAP